MTPQYILSPFTDRYGRAYFVVVGGRDAGIVRKTSAAGVFKWEASSKTGAVICSGRTRKEVADTVANRAAVDA